jgi:hypothetical protein
MFTNLRDSEPASIGKYLCTVNLKRSKYSFRISGFHHLKRSECGIFGVRRPSSKRFGLQPRHYEPIVCVREEQLGSASHRTPAGPRESNRLDLSCDPAPPRGNCDLAEAEPDQSSKTFVQETFKEIGFAKIELRATHIHLLIARSRVRVNRSVEAEFGWIRT